MSTSPPRIAWNCVFVSGMKRNTIWLILDGVRYCVLRVSTSCEPFCQRSNLNGPLAMSIELAHRLLKF